MRRVRFFKIELAGSLDSWLNWVASSSCEVTERPVCTFCPVVFQLAWCLTSSMLGTCSTSGGLQPQATREIQSRVPASLHNLEHFFTLFHSLPLHESHLNTELLIAKIQANLVRNKAKRWLTKFNFTISPFGYSMTKPYVRLNLINHLVGFILCQICLHFSN